jgi:hypothetical protein
LAGEVTSTQKNKRFFFEKRSKKLLPLKPYAAPPRTPKSKSFLVLFFKKEHPSLPTPHAHPIVAA